MTISYIPVGVPFLETFADYILQERDPLRLVQYQILLPTPKACDALKNILWRKQGRSMLLPKIQPLASLNAEDVFLQGGSPDLLKSKLSDRRRHLLLTNLLSKHRGLSTEQASLLANTLKELLNALAWEGIALEDLDLDQLVSADYALHWQTTGDFLKIIQQEWPKILAEEEALEPYAAENLLLEEQAKLWAENPPQHPIIIAGSRGSRPATARLIQQVAALSQGHIILQGLVPADCLEELPLTHPQADLQKLLRFLEIDPRAVYPLKGSLSGPASILEAAFQVRSKPLEVVHREMIQGLSLAECASPQQEAEVIALALRQVLEIPQKTGILITQDLNLVRRVRMALQRWGIRINGSNGTPLGQTSLGSLCALTAKWIHSSFDLGTFLATLKHPLIRALPVDALEKEIIRKGAWSWELILQRSKGTSLEVFVQELDPLLRDCQALAKIPYVSFERVMEKHQQLLGYFLETGLWPKHVAYAEDIKAFWEDLRQASRALNMSMGAEYCKLMTNYLEQACCEPGYTHDRIHIFNLLDARLMHADLVILGGLNEGCWPQDLPADPWFNRATRQKLGLTPPEERIGLSAHDFVQAGAAPQVLLTRSLRVEGTPTVPSSFLVKVQTWLHQQNRGLPVAQELLDWSVPLIEAQPPVSVPTPKPPVDTRPKTLSISDMATWMQNPYGIYAKHVLGLRSLASPFEYNSALLFGTMAHSVLQKILPLMQAKAEGISEVVDRIWHGYASQFKPQEKVFWHWRLQQVVEWFMQLPENRLTQTSYVEIPGHLKIGDFTIAGKIDRVDIREGQAYVIDYKTGTLPAVGFVKYGYSPQLLLEAWMVQEGTMQGMAPSSVTSANLWRLPTGWQNDIRITLEGDALDILLVQLKEKIERLMATFNNPDTPYLCHPRGRLYNSPYDHLARVQEWSTQDSAHD